LEAKGNLAAPHCAPDPLLCMESEPNFKLSFRFTNRAWKSRLNQASGQGTEL